MAITDILTFIADNGLQGESKRAIARELVTFGAFSNFETARSAVKRAVKDESPGKFQATCALAKKILSRGSVSISTLRKELDADNANLTKVLDSMDVVYSGSMVSLEKPQTGRISFDMFDSIERTIGLVSDSHLGSRHAREDALHSLYDHFADAGINKVFHAGNMIDGYIPKLNGAEVICATVDDQTQYVIDNYPAKPGIVTYYITGDDHESWFMKDGFNWGKYLQLTAESQKRNDLKYIGHVEADVEFKSVGGSAIVKVQHPGGGSAYARSYHQQKQVESFQGGEKPAILIQGHNHIFSYILERNVHCISLPGLQDQTIFGRKKRLRFEIGGCIIRFKQSLIDGHVFSVNIELISYFDRGFYKRFLKSDTQSATNHLVIN